jgi:hypothetical protein
MKKSSLDIDSEEDMDLVEIVMMDDGDWEYNRVGIGEYNNRIFLVDLDDSGEESREMKFVKEGMSIGEVLKIGVECGVWKEFDGYDEYDQYRVCMDCDPDAWDNFCSRVEMDSFYI